MQKDVRMVKFTNGYIWTLTKSGKVYQWPIERKFDSNNQLIEKKIGSTREVEPLRGSLTIETGSKLMFIIRRSHYYPQLERINLCDGR